MANAATLSIDATLLPDEIALTLSNISVLYTPADANDGWYYRLTNITGSSSDLIRSAESYIQKGTTPTGVDTGSSSSTVATADKVKFLFIRHLSVTDDGSTAQTADSIYVCFDAGTAAHNEGDCIEIGPGECWFGKLSGATVADVHAISAIKAGGGTSSTKIQCQVAAVLDDVA